MSTVSQNLELIISELESIKQHLPDYIEAVKIAHSKPSNLNYFIIAGVEIMRFECLVRQGAEYYRKEILIGK